MREIKFNSKSYQLKESWHDVTIGDYIQLIDPNNNIYKTISIFTGIDIEEIQNANKFILDQIVKNLDWINHSIPESTDYSITYKGKQTAIDVMNLSFGQYVDLLEMKQTDLHKSMAILLKPFELDYTKYNWIEESENCKSISIVEANNIVGFFLTLQKGCKETIISEDFLINLIKTKKEIIKANHSKQRGLTYLLTLPTVMLRLFRLTIMKMSL